MEEDLKEEEWVCLGKILLVGKKLGIRFRRLVDGCVEPTDQIFEAKGFKCITGGVYLVKVKGSTIKMDLKWLRRFEDSDLIAQWTAESHAYEVEYRVATGLKAEARRNEIHELLRPLRQAYQKTNYIGKMAIELEVLSSLRGHKLGD